MEAHSSSIAVFGGTGGLGVRVCAGLQRQSWSEHVIALGSKDADLANEYEVSGIFSAYKTIGTVVNLSGVNYDGFIHKQSSVLMKRTLEVNALGALHILSHALPQMRQKKYGRIIFVSSFLVDHPTMGTGMYTATKAFLESLVRTTALENAKYGITCNAIRLGYFDGGMTYHVPEWRKLPEKIPAGRLGYVDELVRTIRYIMETEYLNGAIIPLTGAL